MSPTPPAAAASPASRRRRIVVLVNHTAGVGTRVGDQLDRAIAGGGIDVEIDIVRADSAEALREAGAGALAVARADARADAPANAPADASANAPAIAPADAPVDALVVVGGDGMVHLGVGLVAGTGVPLATIPAGTGNDFARAAGLPRGRGHGPGWGQGHGLRGDAIGAIVAGLTHPSASVRRMDALRIRGDDGRETWAANSVNIGFDAVVNERANRLRRIPGTLRYLVALGLVARDFETIPFRVALDDEPLREAPGALITVGNGSTVGGGIRLLPGADLADGQLDVMLVSPLSRPVLAALFPIAALGLHRALPQVSLRRATRIRVEAPESTLVYADGEPVGCGSVTVECVPAAWTLLRGAG